VGFMPAFKYRQKNSLIVFERGHKAHGYVQTADVFLLGNRPVSPGFQSDVTFYTLLEFLY